MLYILPISYFNKKIMITSTFSPVFFSLLIITKIVCVDVVSVKKGSLKPSYDWARVENQNFVPKITVSIYYGSLCPECMNLFENQIGPNLATFQKYVNFDFIPFGDTEKKLFDGRWFFKCRNGFDECLKNKWQVCSIQILQSKQQLLASYLACYMNSTDLIRSAYQCTRKLGLYSYDNYYGKIKKCFMNREQSDLLMIRHGNRTQGGLPRTAPMPCITFNGVYNETEQADAKHNLGNVICKYLYPKPTEMC